VLILDDELIEQLRIVALQPLSNQGVLSARCIGDGKRGGAHFTLRDVGSFPKDALGNYFLEFICEDHTPPKPILNLAA
jgi:hypothetical protein